MLDNGHCEEGVTRLAEWYRYYTPKRIGQQWQRFQMLQGLPGHTILEAGPALGYVAAMPDNAGYQVTNLDVVPRIFSRPDSVLISADLTTVGAAEIGDFDVFLCCETLEHLRWSDVDAVLQTFNESGAAYFLVSVPYEAFQVDFSLYWNRRSLRQRFSLKKLRFLEAFSPDPGMGHKWEVGYRGFSLKDWERKLAGSGWKVIRREFTSPCRSVFHLLRRPDRPQ